jgi:hypothetical protein
MATITATSAIKGTTITFLGSKNENGAMVTQQNKKAPHGRDAFLKDFVH